MHSVPTQYPVVLTDGTREFEVYDATSYVNAVFGSGCRVVTPAPAPAADPEPVVSPPLTRVAPAASSAPAPSIEKAK